MISDELIRERDPSVVRRSGAGCAEDLEAWLCDEAPSSQADGSAVVGSAVDWDAPPRLIALAYDTATQPLPSGVRAILQQGSRRLLFEGQDYELLVRITPHRLTEGYELIGQALFAGLPLPGVAVRIETDGTNTIIQTERSGGFRLARLIGMTCRLSVAANDGVLVTPSLALANADEVQSV